MVILNLSTVHPRTPVSTLFIPPPARSLSARVSAPRGTNPSSSSTSTTRRRRAPRSDDARARPGDFFLSFALRARAVGFRKRVSRRRARARAFGRDTLGSRYESTRDDARGRRRWFEGRGRPSSSGSRARWKRTVGRRRRAGARTRARAVTGTGGARSRARIITVLSRAGVGAVDAVVVGRRGCFVTIVWG